MYRTAGLCAVKHSDFVPAPVSACGGWLQCFDTYLLGLDRCLQIALFTLLSCFNHFFTLFCWDDASGS